jgi:ectoine hydroxylase-related dioxygenase (phytanoyl-CoA dioxygenase family)
MAVEQWQLPADIVDRYCADGFVVLPQHIDTALLRRIVDEWEAFMATDTPTLLPTDAPAAVFWRHVPGEKKRMRPLPEFKNLAELALGEVTTSIARQLAQASLGESELRLLETIVFSKPPGVSGVLSWHQDTAYFPFEPQNQVALWIPLESVDAENGTLEYAVGTHKLGLTCPVDLHTGEPMGSFERPRVPDDPRKEGHQVVRVDLEPGGLAVHDSRTWHRSLPNVSVDRQRRAISLRYLVGKTRYVPRGGVAQSMKLQAGVAPGELISGPTFPLV